MKVTVIIENPEVNEVATLSQDGVWTVNDILWVFKRAMEAAGYSYIDALGAVSKPSTNLQEKEWWTTL